MNKTYRHDKKGHDDYLLSSNRVLNSEKSVQDSKKMNFRKLSLSSNPLLQEKQRSVALKFNSLTKISQKSIPKSNRKFKGSTHNDEYVAKTMRTEETVEKKYKHSLEPKTSIKTSKNASGKQKQHKRNRSKIKLDYQKNKKPLKLSKSGRFDYEDNFTQNQPLKNFTQITCHDNDNEDKETKIHCQSSMNNLGSLDQVYSHCVTVMGSYKKKIDQLSKQNSKLRHENKKLKETHKNK